MTLVHQTVLGVFGNITKAENEISSSGSIT